MKKLISVAALAAAAALLAAPVSAGPRETTGTKEAALVKKTITISCFRGPWTEVIWDRANAPFIDSLIDVGYDYATAYAIGERICRDPALVGRPDALKAAMLTAYSNAPVYRSK